MVSCLTCIGALPVDQDRRSRSGVAISAHKHGSQRYNIVLDHHKASNSACSICTSSAYGRIAFHARRARILPDSGISWEAALTWLRKLASKLDANLGVPYLITAGCP